MFTESKEQRGETQIFVFGLDSQVRSSWLLLGSQKSSQMAPYAVKSKNAESLVDINNLF